MPNPYPPSATAIENGLEMSWKNEFGEVIRVFLDTAKATSGDKKAMSESLTITHSDNLLAGITLYPAITRVGGTSPRIKDGKGKSYILQDNEADFIDYAVRVLLGFRQP